MPSQVVQTYVNPAVETLAYQDCLAVADVTQTGGFFVPQLQNGTLYEVTLVATDLSYNSRPYSALVKMQDLTPPAFTRISQCVSEIF